MTLTTKLGAGLLATSSVAGLGYAGSRYFEKDAKKVDTAQQVTTINDLITERYDYILLDTSNDSGNKDKSKWTENWNTYRTTGDNIFQLNGWKAGDSSLDLTTELKAKCKDLASQEKSDDAETFYKNVTKYCARGVTFEEQAKKDKAEILDTGNSKHSNIWQKRLNEKVQLNASLKKLGITEDPSSVDAIKNGCNTNKSKNKQEREYVSLYAAYKLVCTRQESDPKE